MAIFCIGNLPSDELAFVRHNRMTDPPRAVEITNAIVPPLEIVTAPPIVAHAGVYKEGELVPESILKRAQAGQTRDVTLPYETLPSASKTIPEAVFGGYLFHHFGHFLIESMARLWWVTENNYSGPVLFQIVGKRVPKYQMEMFERLGIEPVFVRQKDCIQVEHLVVPEAANIERVSGHAYWTAPFQKIRQSYASDSPYSAGEKLYVSRGTGVSKVFGESEIQSALEVEGYRTLDPAIAPLNEQIGAFANARSIVGMLGSAMHNLVYAEKAESVAIICRSPRMHHNFPIVDQCVGTYDSTYIYPDVRSPLPNTMGPRGTFFVDPQSTLALLRDAGFLQKTHTINEASLVRLRDDYMSEYTRLFKRYCSHLEKPEQPPVAGLKQS